MSLSGASNNPYDIYGHSAPAETSVLHNIIESPVGIAGFFAVELLGIPALAGEKGLRRTMLPGQWEQFKSVARAKYGTGPKAIQNLVLHGKPTDFIPQKAWLPGRGGVMGGGGHLLASSSARGVGAADRMFHSGLRNTYGAAATTRIGLGRALNGLSRGLMAYSMFSLGIGVINGINDMIESYEKPLAKTPFHRDLETGGNFVDTRSAQTQRARAIQAIHNTQLSTRAALGNEASILHAQRR